MKTIGIILLAIVALVAGLSIYLQPNDFSLCPIDQAPTSRKDCQPVDAIIAVSGGDTQARTAHAVQLYKHGWSDTIIFSGAAKDTSGPSNALVMRRTAIADGVPPSAILIEQTSIDTSQNAANSKELLKNHDISSVILVTSGYHQRRASLEFHKQLGDAVTIQNSPTYDKDWNKIWWLKPRGWWLAGGEFVKIIAFYAGIGQ